MTYVERSGRSNRPPAGSSRRLTGRPTDPRHLQTGRSASTGLSHRHVRPSAASPDGTNLGPTDSRLFLYAKTSPCRRTPTHLHLRATIDNDVEIWVERTRTSAELSRSCDGDLGNNISTSTFPTASLTARADARRQPSVAVEAVDYRRRDLLRAVRRPTTSAAPPPPTNVTLLSATPTGGRRHGHGPRRPAARAAANHHVLRQDGLRRRGARRGRRGVGLDPGVGQRLLHRVRSAPGSGHLVAIPSARTIRRTASRSGVDNTSWPNAAPLTGNATGFRSTSPG